MIMTEIDKDNTMENLRIKRRSLLKAGAVIAPLALTLHGGISMAHASSTGCVDDLKEHVRIPTFDGEGNPNGDVPFDPENGLTGRLNENGTPETHWDYLTNEELYGASCLQSIENSGLTVS